MEIVKLGHVTLSCCNNEQTDISKYLGHVTKVELV